MSSLNTDMIIQLAKEKTVEKEKLALETVESLRKSGEKITFYSVAKRTGLSKTFLYNNTSVRQEIESARAVVTGTEKTKSDSEVPNVEQLLLVLEKMKDDDPKGYERICAFLAESDSSSNTGEKAKL